VDLIYCLSNKVCTASSSIRHM